MRCTVRKEIQEAVAAYEDKPRDQWLFDYPAQVFKNQKQTHNENNLERYCIITPRNVRNLLFLLCTSPHSFSNM